MKKKYLTYAGIISAGILIFMFISIFIYGAFPVPTPGSTNSTSYVLPHDSPGTPTSQYGSCTRSSSHFITIDTLPDIRMNRSYTLRGTTDLPAGEELFVTVLPLEYEVDVNPKNGSMSGMVSGAVGTVKVEQGNGSTNLWSFELQTGRLDPNTRNYFINVSNDRFDPRFVSGDTFCKQRFIVKSG
jgi:hypothetical protein